MGSSGSTGLSRLQDDLLRAFFDRTDSFFLTGGAALAGFYLHHRDTKDLDLFASAQVDIHEGIDALTSSVAAVGATAKILRESGDFRRFVVERGQESTLVDLVIDRVPQLDEQKSRFGRIRVDPVREIAANKLCALLDRIEVRDLFDLKLLLESSLRLEDVLEGAQRKHASADPATLAWALAEFHLGPSLPMPHGVTTVQLEIFRDSLIDRLTRMALPAQPA